MFEGKKTIAIFVLAISIISTGFCQDQSLEENWNNFLHYTLISNLDLAKGYAQAILQSNPDPVQLFNLSNENPQSYQILLRANGNEYDAELAELSGKILDLIEKGGFVRRSDPVIIAEEIKRLNSTERGWSIAVERLRNAGEYAIPFIIEAISNPSSEDELANIVRAIPEIGKDAIRPLVAALQTGNTEVKSEIITALGKIRYPQSLPYLKYVLENDSSQEVRQLASASIREIDPAALNVPAAQLFYQLAENYYYHAQSLSPAEDAPTANIWFWDSEGRRLKREAVDKDYFYELMAMRTCEWSLKADANFGSAIGLWLAAYFKAESAGVGHMPDYFGVGHPKATDYAYTAGVEYLLQALARAVNDGNTYVALGVIEALGKTAGEKSLLHRIGTEQPLIRALSFNDRLVRYSAAIAIASAGPTEPFVESKLVVANLAEALGANSQTPVQAEVWDEEIANSYATQAAKAMLEVAQTRNPVIDLSLAQTALINATNDSRTNIQVLAGQILAHLNSLDAQSAIASMALDTNNDIDEVRIDAFKSLATSAKLNANKLDDGTIDRIYELISSDETDPDLRSAAAIAYGALNLPSRKVKDLILDQAKS